MIYLLAGYMFLFIFRPFEYWPELAEWRIERLYMIFLMISVFFWKGKRYVPHSINRKIVFFLAVMFLSSLMALNAAQALDSTYDYFKIVVFYVLVVLTVRNEEDLQKFIMAYLAVMFVYVGKSAWEFFIHDRYIWRMGIRRMVGVDLTYGDPNAFAASIAYSLPFLWAMIRLGHPSRWVRKSLWAYGILGIVCIIFTGSRSGMVTCLFFLLLLWWESSKKFAGSLMLIGVLALGWNYMPDDLQGRFLSIFVEGVGPAAESAEASAEGRIAGLKQGIRLFKENPLLGVGPNNFKLTWKDKTNPHNLYGQALGELGGLGFLAFGGLVWCIYRTQKKNRKIIDEQLGDHSGENDQLLRYTAIASMQAILLLLFNGNFGHNLYRYNWLWIGAIAVLTSLFLKERASKENAL